MLRSLLLASGIARLVGTAKLRLEQKADAALGQVKSIAIRIAVAAALAIAAVIFTLLAIVAGLVLLFTWLEPQYGPTTSLAIIAGSLVVVALLLALAAALAGRVRSTRKEEHADLARWHDEKDIVTVEDARASRDALAPLAGVSAPARLSDLFRPDPTRPRTDVLAMLQTGDTRTTVAVLGALFAVGWLLGRTLPAAESRHFFRR
jgi:hypothetical protein